LTWIKDRADRFDNFLPAHRRKRHFQFQPNREDYTMEQEKDNFWIYIVGVIIAAAVVLYMVKSSEHEKYATAAKAISEDASQSAYRDTSSYKR
jgi:predicted membrane channel-forming protein YqfA (hemolysin III family)